MALQRCVDTLAEGRLGWGSACQSPSKFSRGDPCFSRLDFFDNGNKIENTSRMQLRVFPHPLRR